MKARLLIVDDLPSNRYLVRMLLETRGYEIEEAEGGEDALAKARVQPPDVIVTDLLMPGMDGFTLCRAWHADPALSSIPFIVYTATFTDPKDRQLALDLGASAYVLKPAEADELERVIAQVMNARDAALSNPVEDSALVSRYAARLKDKLDDRLARLRDSELALAEQLAHQERVLDGLPLAVIALDAKLRVVDWNLPAEELIGVHPFEGRPFLTLVPPGIHPEVTQLLASARADGTSDLPQGLLVGASGEVVPVMLSVIHLGSERGLLVSARDRRAELRAAEETQRLAAQVAQIDRLATVGMLAAGVAHEMNNPLMHVLFNLERIARDLPLMCENDTDVDVESMTSRIEETLESAQRIHEISRGLSSFSRTERETEEPVDLRAAIDAACTMAHNEIRPRARLVQEHETDTPVRGTPGRLAQVFLNLFINAAHAIGDGAAEDNEIRVRSWREGSLVFATVRDTGPGIPAEIRERIFEPLFSTKSYGRGSGLGLAISKNIVEKFGGRISIDSKLGEYTEFTIVLPAVEEAPPSRSSRAVLSDPDVSLRVLVVDDEPMLRRALARVLEQHEVALAEGVEEAKRVLAADAAFDAIVCDVNMPGALGTELHRWLVEVLPPLAPRMVFMSGSAPAGDAARYLAKVSNPILEKPTERAALLAAIASVAGS